MQLARFAGTRSCHLPTALEAAVANLAGVPRRCSAALPPPARVEALDDPSGADYGRATAGMRKAIRL